VVLVGDVVVRVVVDVDVECVVVDFVVAGGLVLPGIGLSPQFTWLGKSQSMFIGSYTVPGPQQV